LTVDNLVDWEFSVAMPLISVIICTHNPRLSYLQRVLDGLRAQTLPTKEWELLLIDNASEQPVGEHVKLEWHPGGHYIREAKLGLTHARLRGIADSNAGLLVFVDDDNVLAPGYLKQTLEIARQHSMLGAWSGQVVPEFEIPPSEELQHFLGLLCIRKLERDFWGNELVWARLPWGAGMSVRREVAQHYQQDVSGNVLRLSLGHAGNRASCHDDLDLAMTSLDLGLGTGLFTSLMLTHLIPARRLNESYLLQLAENAAAAFVVLRSCRGLKIDDMPAGVHRWIQQLEYWRASPVQKKAADAQLRGIKTGRAMVADLATPRQNTMPARSI